MKKIIFWIMVLCIIAFSVAADAGERQRNTWAGVGYALGAITAIDILRDGYVDWPADVFGGYGRHERHHYPHERTVVIHRYVPSCDSVYECEYERESARLERQRQREWERYQREKARNDARRDYGY